MPLITPAYTAPTTTGIASGLTNASADVRNLVESSSGINDTLAAIDDQRALGVRTSNTTLVANRDVFVPCTTASGGITITLPALADHSSQPIVIPKLGADYNTLTIAGAGSDKLYDQFSPLATPTAASIALKAPGSTITLYPYDVSGTKFWWVQIDYTNRVSFRAFRSSNQVITGASGIATKVQFNNEDFDIGGYFDNSTNYRFTPLIAGRYFVNTTLQLSGAETPFVTDLFKNGTRIQRLASDDVSGTNRIGTGCALVEMNGTTDYLEIYVTGDSSYTVLGSTDRCQFSGFLVSR